MMLATVKAFGTLLESWLMPVWLWRVDHVGMVACFLLLLLPTPVKELSTQRRCQPRKDGDPALTSALLSTKGKEKSC